MVGTDVRHIQQALKWFGLYCGKVDGVFGPETEHAVRKFQRLMKIKPTGIADGIFFDVLQKMIKKGAGEWVTLKRDFCHTGHSPVFLGSSLEVSKLAKVKGLVALTAKKNSVFVAEENSIGAFDLGNKKFKWRKKISPSSMSLAQEAVLVSASSLVALDAYSGEAKFEFARDDFESPAVANENGVYASSRSGVLYALNWSGEIMWRYRTGADYITPMTLALDFLYFGSLSVVYCLDDKGALFWKARLPGFIKGPVSVFEKKAFAVNDEGSIFCLDARTGKMLWNKNFGEKIHALCFLEKSAIVVASSGKVMSIDTEEGNVKWEEDLNVSPAALPLSCADAIFIPTDAGLVMLKPGGERVKTYFEGRSISHVIQARLGLLVAADGCLWDFSPLERL
ncbi:Outer membrane protein assembly factor BamB, contains PQQ-like beta-propeller repeat [Caldanaerovirga acetigignens]|uniref:Outer membrane protein assembly factor BamB, contains PQQ-like beta-propeller repeat n=2 Tax=Caldanaerovirga acetigignens TaxID=447595 RepID=A0A1M7GHN8_9FIRM|nr:Outer membrane protein assembly factor BamB, contains PQQ-like beta-propeller repeat [Caldanaerovirga acetigignens]